MDIKSMTIPNSVTTIGEAAFLNCKSLTSIEIPNSVTEIGVEAFNECDKLSTVKLSENITTIKDKTFRRCNLSSITIPDNVRYIKYMAFTGTKLETLTIGSGIETIDDYAFGSKSIKDVYCKSINVPRTSNVAFLSDGQGSVIRNAILHVPAESIENYKVTSPWNKFKEIVALKDDDTGIQPTIIGNIIIDIHTLSGAKQQTPSKGVNIIKQKDGTTKKVLVK